MLTRLKAAIATRGDYDFSREWKPKLGQITKEQLNKDYSVGRKKFQIQLFDGYFKLCYEDKDAPRKARLVHIVGDDIIVCGACTLEPYPGTISGFKAHNVGQILVHKDYRRKKLGKAFYQIIAHEVGPITGDVSQSDGARQNWCRLSQIGSVHIFSTETDKIIKNGKNVKLTDPLDPRVWQYEDDDDNLFDMNAQDVALYRRLLLTEIKSFDGISIII